MKETNNVVLCGANSYEQKYYLNPDFEGLPQSIKDELKIICVTYTAEAGGIITLEFIPDGTLIFCTRAAEHDLYFDEISAGLKISQFQREKTELLESLELYYRMVILV